jgi:small neutral amino acid transporter SnatA (MarC family)
MKKKIVRTTIIAAVIAVAVLLVFMLKGKKEVQYQTETAIKGSLSITVMATGYIQPTEKEQYEHNHKNTKSSTNV